VPSQGVRVQRLNVCSVHSCGNSIKYGRAITAYQEGFETIWTVTLWCRSVSDWPDWSSLVNSNFFVCAPPDRQRQRLGDQDAAR